MSLFFPTNQKRLTNVSIVKYTSKLTGEKKHKFEVACYPNKVHSWRQKLEKNIKSVLQSEYIYTNVSKGEIASKESLEAVFGTNDVMKCVEIILDKGELHLTEKERDMMINQVFKDVAAILASQTVHKSTKLCFTSQSIERLMKNNHINLKLNKSAKIQSRAVLKLLRDKFNVPMQLVKITAVINAPSAQKVLIRNSVLTFADHISKEDDDFITATFEPGKFEEFNTDFADLVETRKIQEIEEFHKNNHDDENIEEEESDVDEAELLIDSVVTSETTADKKVKTDSSDSDNLAECLNNVKLEGNSQQQKQQRKMKKNMLKSTNGDDMESEQKSNKTKGRKKNKKM